MSKFIAGQKRPLISESFKKPEVETPVVETKTEEVVEEVVEEVTPEVVEDEVVTESVADIEAQIAALTVKLEEAKANEVK